MFSELFRNLRQHLPAHIALFIFMIFDCANDQYNMTDTVETVYACRGADTIAEEVDMTSDVESSMKIWLVKGCVA
jgi:cation transport regulator ChaB